MATARTAFVLLMRKDVVLAAMAPHDVPHTPVQAAAVN